MVASVRPDPAGGGKALWLRTGGFKGENLEAERPHNTVAELRRRQRPEAAWLCAVCWGSSEAPRSWKKGRRLGMRAHDCQAGKGLW